MNVNNPLTQVAIYSQFDAELALVETVVQAQIFNKKTELVAEALRIDNVAYDVQCQWGEYRVKAAGKLGEILEKNFPHGGDKPSIKNFEASSVEASKMPVSFKESSNARIIYNEPELTQEIINSINKENTKNKSSFRKKVITPSLVSAGIRKAKVIATRKAQAKEGESIKINIDLRHGDFKLVLADIPDNTVDLVLTDPPYPYEFIQCWSDLAIFAKRVLKPNGFCIAYSGQFYLPEVMQRLSEHLNYYWTFCLHHTGQGTQIVNGVNIMCRWKPILIYQNGKKKISTPIQDYIASGGKEKSGHDWQQSGDGVSELIKYFSNPNELVVDPFAGSATTLIEAYKLKRRCMGAEIDEETYNIAKAKINKYE